MTNILIIGAHGLVARVAIRLLLERTDAVLTLYLRRAGRLEALASNPRIRLVEGNAMQRRSIGQWRVSGRRLCQSLGRHDATGKGHHRVDEEGGRATADFR